MVRGRVLVVFGLASLLFSFGLFAQSQEVPAQSLVVGYFPQWGLYDQPAYLVKNLADSGAAANLNQLNYAQGFVTGGHCSVADPHADTELAYSAAQSVDGIADGSEQALRGSFNQLLKLKRRYPKLKLVLSLEGHSSDFFADSQPAQRASFVASCVSLFLAGHIAPGVELGRLFDGIDVDWEYPGVDGSDNFLALLAEFRKQMDALRPGLLLTVAVGPNPEMAGGRDLSGVARLVDEVGLMTYDMAGPWSQRTGFLAPLFGQDGHTGGTVGVVHAYEEAGVPASKLLIGVPFYGYTWKKVPEDADGLFQEGDGMRGDHPYSEIAGLTANYRLHRDPVSGSPWLFDGDQFWTFDDPVSIRAKAVWAREHGLGGMMAWELGGDTASAALVKAMYEGFKENAAVAATRRR